MTALTVRGLITNVLRRMRVIAVGEDATADMLDDGQRSLNQLIALLALQSLTIYTITRSTWTITSTKGTPSNPYTVGTGGDINIARPVYLSQVRYQDTSVSPVLEYPMAMITEQAYALIPQKTLTSPLPGMAYYNPTYPLGSLYFWMIPTQANLQGVIYAQTAVPEFAALTDTIALPPGYERMLRDQLVVDLWPDYRSDPMDPGLIITARESLSIVKAANVRPTDLSIDPAVLPHGGAYYDIRSDSYGL